MGARQAGRVVAEPIGELAGGTRVGEGGAEEVEKAESSKGLSGPISMSIKRIEGSCTFCFRL